jgi:hypothetical protein
MPLPILLCSFVVVQTCSFAEPLLSNGYRTHCLFHDRCLAMGLHATILKKRRKFSLRLCKHHATKTSWCMKVYLHYSWLQHYMEVGGRLHAPTTLLQRSHFWYPLDKRLCGTQSKSGPMEERKAIRNILWKFIEDRKWMELDRAVSVRNS